MRQSRQPVPGSYIVVLEAGARVDAGALVRAYPGARVRQTYARGIRAFSLSASEADALRLSRDPRVKFIEQDSIVTASTTWGLDRIDQRLLPLDDRFTPDGSGAGVTIYVVDTGIEAGHVEFGSRVASGFTAFADGRGSDDCHGHGTHVAGVAGGATYGVARSASLVPVRVLDCNGSGTVSSVLAGLDWILQQSARPAVVNMSFGGDLSSAVDLQVAALIEAGYTTVVAAGNANVDACLVSPARVRDAVTVGATSILDARASFSNYGTCVDLFAPGLSIVSASNSSSTATAVGSGTSAAAPFVTGVAALVLERYPAASAGSVSETLKAQATAGILTGLTPGSPNRLLYSTVGTLAEPPAPEQQLLADPGFDYGTVFWSSDICAVVKPTGCAPEEMEVLQVGSRSGDAHAAVGGPARSFYLTSEAVKVPRGATSVELSFYLWVVTKEVKDTVADTLRVEILDGNGTLLETLDTLSNRDASSEWLQRRFDVSRYSGRTIRVSFTGVNAQGPPTWFLLDDVTLTVQR